MLWRRGGSGVKPAAIWRVPNAPRSSRKPLFQGGNGGRSDQATREKGQKFVEAVVARMVTLIQEFRAREIRARVDHH